MNFGKVTKVGGWRLEAKKGFVASNLKRSDPLTSHHTVPNSEKEPFWVDTNYAFSNT